MAKREEAKMKSRATGSCSVIHFLHGREIGAKKSLPVTTQQCAEVLAEEKATLPNKNLPCELSGHTRSTLLVAFSPDGTRLASTHCDHTVRITEIRTGKTSHILSGHPRTPWSIAYHPSSNDILATGCLGGEVRIWDLRGGGSEVWRTDENVSITSLAFHPVDQVLVIALVNELLFWDWTQQPEPFTRCKTSHAYEKVRWVKFDPAGHWLYTGIANSSTVHADEEDIGYIGSDEMNYPHPHSGPTGPRDRRLRHQYQAIVEEITQRQRDRINLHYPPPVGSSTAGSPGGATAGHGATGRSTLSSLLSTFDTPTEPMRVPSPHHLTAVNDARSYAARTSQNIQNARNYAANMSRPHRHTPLNIPLEPIEPEQTDPRLDSLPSASFSPFTSLATSRPSASASRPINRGFSFDTLLRSQLSVHDAMPRFSFGNSSTTVTSSITSSTTSSSLHPRTSSQSANSRSLSFRENSAIGAVTVVAGSSPGGARQPSSTTSSTLPSSASISDSSAAAARQARITSFFNNTLPRPTLGPASSASTASNPGLLSLFSTSSSISSTPSRIPSASVIFSSSTRPSASTTSSSSAAASSSSSYLSSMPTSQPCHTDPCPNCPTCGPFPRYRGLNTGTHRAGSTRLRDILLLDRQSQGSNNNNMSSSPSQRRISALLGPQRHQPHRLASIIESEVRQTLDQVRSRRIDISETLRDLDQLRNELSTGRQERPSAPGTEPQPPQTDSDNTSGNTDGTPIEITLGAATDENSSSSTATADTLSQDRRSDSDMDTASADSNDGSDHGSAQPLLPIPESISEPDLPSAAAAHSFPPATPAPDSDSSDQDNALHSIGAYSAELENRVNELDQRVYEIQRRLNERMRALSQERQRQFSSRAPGGGPFQRRSYQGSTPYENRSERVQRMRAHLDELRRVRHNRNRRQAAAEAAGSARRGIEDEPLPSSSSSSRVEPEVSSRIQRMARLRAVHQDIQNMREEIARRRQQVRDSERAWQRLQRRSLHPDYSTSILDDTLNNEGEGLQAAVNRVIAGAYLANGESSVASNIGNPTHRIQQWDFSKCVIPDISDSEHNVIVPHCKIHNDANCDISANGRLLATIVPSHRGFPDDLLVAVFSLMPDTRGQCLFTKSFGPNAISLSLSPLNNYILVGLASKRVTFTFTPKQLVAQVYKFVKPQAGEESTDHVCDIMHPCDTDIRAPVSINSARWLPGVGEGLVYGTNRGDLHVYRPGFEQEEKRTPVNPNPSNPPGGPPETNSLRRNLMHMLGLTVPRTISTSTQTVHRVRRTASTQTDPAVGDEQAGPSHAH